MKLNLGQVESPLGTLLIVTDEQRCLRALEFAERRTGLCRKLREHYGQYELATCTAPIHIVTALQNYFKGDATALECIDTVTAGSNIQRRVWSALRRIPAGQTTSYGELARSLGYDDPRMAIEIGAANRENPIAIVLPCHRVIGKHGDLKGYAWGINRKRWLLEHERAIPSAQPVNVSRELRLPGF